MQSFKEYIVEAVDKEAAALKKNVGKLSDFNFSGRCGSVKDMDDSASMTKAGYPIDKIFDKYVAKKMDKIYAAVDKALNDHPQRTDSIYWEWGSNGRAQVETIAKNYLKQKDELYKHWKSLSDIYVAFHSKPGTLKNLTFDDAMTLLGKLKSAKYYDDIEHKAMPMFPGFDPKALRAEYDKQAKSARVVRLKVQGPTKLKSLSLDFTISGDSQYLSRVEF